MRNVIYSALGITITLLYLTGCAGTAGSGAGSKGIVLTQKLISVSQAHQEKVSTDLVAAMIQLPSMAPFYTTVQFSEPRDTFGQFLLDAMSDSGYGIQMVTADQGANYMTYRVSSEGDDNEGKVRYTIRVNTIEISRDYEIANSRIFPTSELVIKGAEATRILVNNDLFIYQGGQRVFPAGVTFLHEDGTVMSSEIRPVTASTSQFGTLYDAARALIIAKASTFTTARINTQPGQYTQTNFKTIKHLSMRFRRNSLDLGELNKAALSNLVNEFDEVDHIFMITGCSHGKSMLWDGTESMSLSRSQRVKEELLLHGILSEQIIEESCFQTSYPKELLPNSVILTLKERNKLRLI